VYEPGAGVHLIYLFEPGAGVHLSYALTTPGGFPCCVRFPCVHAVSTTPAQRLGSLLLIHPIVSAFPELAIDLSYCIGASLLQKIYSCQRVQLSQSRPLGLLRSPAASDLSTSCDGLF